MLAPRREGALRAAQHRAGRRAARVLPRLLAGRGAAEQPGGVQRPGAGGHHWLGQGRAWCVCGGLCRALTKLCQTFPFTFEF